MRECLREVHRVLKVMIGNVLLQPRQLRSSTYERYLHMDAAIAEQLHCLQQHLCPLAGTIRPVHISRSVSPRRGTFTGTRRRREHERIEAPAG